MAGEGRSGSIVGARINHKLKNKIDVYLEVGSKRVFAAAVDWPGWCRMGRNETAALQALFQYGPRYEQVARSARLGFQVPKDISDFVIVERLKGNTTTDFGAPDVPPTSDTQPLDDSELRRLQSLLKACWQAFDTTAHMAQGKSLQTGTRGGGRSLDVIVQHVLGAEAAYLSQLGGKVTKTESARLSPELVRQTILKTLKAFVHGEIDEYGPRGGKRWSARYFVRRDTWHILDHNWEIEDRLADSAA